MSDRATRVGTRDRAAAIGITDSKAVARFGSVKAQESLALAWARRILGRVPADADEMLDVFALDGVTALRKPCPSRATAQCWHELSVPAFGGDVEEGQGLLDALASMGIEVLWVRSSVSCVKKLNESHSRGVSRFAANLIEFQHLIARARAATRDELDVVCGMVGGYRKYEAALASLLALVPDSSIEVLEETRTRSHYRVEKVGNVAFEVDADANHIHVALASLFGKYLRELWMERHNRYYGAADATLEAVSGYHDPRTRAFILASASLRKKRQIPDTCFVRA